MPCVRFKPTIPAVERAKTLYALDLVTTVIGIAAFRYSFRKYQQINFRMWLDWNIICDLSNHVTCFWYRTSWIQSYPHPPNKYFPTFIAWAFSEPRELCILSLNAKNSFKQNFENGIGLTNGHLPWPIRLSGLFPFTIQLKFKRKLRTHRHPCLEWDSNPQRYYMPYTARPLWSSQMTWSQKYLFAVKANARFAVFFFCGSTALWTLAAFSVSYSYTQSVGLLERGNSHSQGRHLHTEHKHRINAGRHPCLK
jgi:hypothetical protein